MNNKFSLSKNERINNKKDIELLFSKGKIIKEVNVKGFFYIKNEVNYCGVQALFSCPKKNWKKAVDRNYVKRQMREIYRTHKTIIKNCFAHNNTKLIGFVFTKNQNLEFENLKKDMLNILEKIKNETT